MLALCYLSLLTFLSWMNFIWTNFSYFMDEFLAQPPVGRSISLSGDDGKLIFNQLVVKLILMFNGQANVIYSGSIVSLKKTETCS
ncbi:hypothetical protein LDENG_00294850 [Lucifuga dentata]|nr:hypothetical protein LDENG_00294850 [Lucifuga dentata]